MQCDDMYFILFYLILSVGYAGLVWSAAVVVCFSIEYCAGRRRWDKTRKKDGFVWLGSRKLDSFLLGSKISCEIDEFLFKFVVESYF